jgi:hypothetical protein
MKTQELEIDISFKIIAADKEKKTLNKPFRTSDGPKKFSVYVKNEKGNVVKVNFGDPNMEIKRDDPARRKSFRARHGCDKNPGPKWKAKYWSCRQWRSSAPVEGSVATESEANKGLWYNIQKKKERMGKNYKPAKPGDKDYPKQGALKKAQANEEEWDGITFWDGSELLKIWPDLSKAEEMMESEESEMEEYKNEYLEMSIGSLNSIKTHAENILNALNDENVKENLTESFLQGKIAITEDYMVMIHNYIMFAEESNANYMSSEPMFMVGQKVRNVNKNCNHYGSEGIIKEIKDLPNQMGKVISYEVINEGQTYKKGEVLTKTVDQLSRAQTYASYEEEEEYKSMCETEGQNFKDFLQKCIPSQEGTDKEKFQTCLLQYKKNK